MSQWTALEKQLIDSTDSPVILEAINDSVKYKGGMMSIGGEKVCKDLAILEQEDEVTFFISAYEEKDALAIRDEYERFFDGILNCDIRIII